MSPAERIALLDELETLNRSAARADEDAARLDAQHLPAVAEAHRLWARLYRQDADAIWRRLQAAQHRNSLTPCLDDIRRKNHEDELEQARQAARHRHPSSTTWL